MSCTMRVPQPFPTRRSSDLGCVSRGRRYAEERRSTLVSIEGQILKAHCQGSEGREYRQSLGTLAMGLEDLPLDRSEEHTSELQSRENSYAVFCLTKKNTTT